MHEIGAACPLYDAPAGEVRPSPARRRKGAAGVRKAARRGRGGGSLNGGEAEAEADGEGEDEGEGEGEGKRERGSGSNRIEGERTREK